MASLALGAMTEGADLAEDLLACAKVGRSPRSYGLLDIGQVGWVRLIQCTL